MIINFRTANMFGLIAPLSLLAASRRHADRRVEFGTGFSPPETGASKAT
jgi:hypothetical protein